MTNKEPLWRWYCLEYLYAYLPRYINTAYSKLQQHPNGSFVICTVSDNKVMDKVTLLLRSLGINFKIDMDNDPDTGMIYEFCLRSSKKDTVNNIPSDIIDEVSFIENALKEAKPIDIYKLHVGSKGCIGDTIYEYKDPQSTYYSGNSLTVLESIILRPNYLNLCSDLDTISKFIFKQYIFKLSYLKKHSSCSSYSSDESFIHSSLLLKLGINNNLTRNQKKYSTTYSTYYGDEKDEVVVEIVDEYTLSITPDKKISNTSLDIANSNLKKLNILSNEEITEVFDKVEEIQKGEYHNSLFLKLLINGDQLSYLFNNSLPIQNPNSDTISTSIIMPIAIVLLTIGLLIVNSQ